MLLKQICPTGDLSLANKPLSTLNLKRSGHKESNSKTRDDVPVAIINQDEKFEAPWRFTACQL